MALPNFQRNALQEVEELLGNISKVEHNGFQEVVAKRETYLKATIKAPQHVLEVYIYEDEAGYLLDGKKWTIFEKFDFSSSSEQLHAFLISFGDKLR